MQESESVWNVNIQLHDNYVTKTKDALTLWQEKIKTDKVQVFFQTPVLTRHSPYSPAYDTTVASRVFLLFFFEQADGVAHECADTLECFTQSLVLVQTH